MWCRGGWIARALVALALVLMVSTARAQVRIEGEEARVRLTADKAPLADVLAALKAKFRLSYASVTVERQITGTYSGTLHQVVVRLLDGFDFVVGRSGEGVEIVQVAPRGMATATRQGNPGVTRWDVPNPQAMAHPPR